jgi:hypothetical protein
MATFQALELELGDAVFEKLVVTWPRPFAALAP